MSEARKKAKGLLDPVNSSNRLPHANIPSPSNYLPTNSSVGTGYNTLAQVLAHGISPGISGDKGYYHQGDFRRPDGKMSGMAQYAPQLQSGQKGAWGQSRWQEWLRSQGVGAAGNSQRLGIGQPQGQPSGQPGGQIGGQGPNMLPNNFLQWLQSTYPGINFGAIMNGGLGGNAISYPPASMASASPQTATGPLGGNLQELLQMMRNRK